jgi:hypothetical protein
MTKLLRATALFLLCFLALTTHGQTKPGNVSSPVTNVFGRLRSKIVFGPTGFGETPKTDSKVGVFYMQLRTPLTPEQLHLSPGGGADRRKSYSEVQLWCGNGFDSCEKFLRSHINRAISASGVTAYALEPSDVFPVTITVGALDTK